MGLGLPNSGGDAANRTPIIKYDARAGRLFRIDRSNASGSWESTQTEITNGFQAIFDLEQIETGWLCFPAGGAPDIRTVPIGQPIGERPSDKHKTGFRVLMKLGKSIGGDVRELAANASVSIKGMDALYDAFNAQRGVNAGKLPVVKLATTLPITTSGQGQSSTNYQPVWEIVSWVDRPEDLPLRGASAPPAQQQPVQQMKPTEQAAPAPSSEDEF